MELVSKIDTAGDSGWRVDEEGFDLLDESRLVRPLKRRCIASESLCLNSCSAKASQKTIDRNDETLVKVAAVDPVYEKFWEHMVQFVDADHSGGMINEEEFDFVSDLKFTMQCKGRSIASENRWLNSFSNKGSRKAIKKSNENNEALVEAVTVNSDHEELVDYMVLCFDVDNDDDNDEWCVANVDDKDQVSEVLDAQYMMFLDNLKEDGKSYVLKHALSNGTSVVVKYEEENDLDTGLGMGNLETMKDCHNIKDIKRENFVRSQLDREKIGRPRRILRSNLGKKMNKSSIKALRGNSVTKKTKSSKAVLRNSSRWRKTELARKTLKSGSIREEKESLSLKEAVNRDKTESLRTLRSNPGRENSNSPSILDDAVKREKTERLGTLRSNPQGENNKSASIRDDAVKREKTESLEILRSNPQVENNKSPTILNDPVKGEKTELNRTLKNGSRRESMGTEKKLRDAYSIDKKSPLIEKNAQMETKKPVSCPKNGYSIKTHSLEGTHLAKQRFNHGIKSEFVDERYQIHLNFLKKDDRCLVHAPEGGQRMVHFRDDESDSEVVVLDDPFFTGGKTPFISSRAHVHVNEDGEGFTENNESQFRDGLFEILQKPYDFTEYTRLQIDSRPYLRMHDDFAEAIRQAKRDRRKLLNLFRGFFYWLQYLHSEGAFMPWLDSQCLSILPPDDY